MIDRYQQLLQTALDYRANQDWPRAIAAFRRAIDTCPTEPLAFAELGSTCIAMGRLDRALESYKVAARLSHGDLVYLNHVADLQERLGQVHEAGRTYLATAEVALRQNDLESAIGNWERASRLEPALLGPHKRLAMAYQRLGRTRDAVREYLAIARILQARGEHESALRMCQAALRLDPTNADVLTAVQLIQQGADAFEPDPEPALSKEEESLNAALRAMADVFELESEGWRTRLAAAAGDPLQAARRQAQEDLAEEVFREDDMRGDTPLTKLERDALIGQALDFERRGYGEQAIQCYEQAIAGGLNVPAGYFALGMLYLDIGRAQPGRQALATAVAMPSTHPLYRQAAQIILNG